MDSLYNMSDGHGEKFRTHLEVPQVEWINQQVSTGHIAISIYEGVLPQVLDNPVCPHTAACF